VAHGDRHREWVQAKATIEIERDGKSETAIVEGEGSVLVEWPFAPIRPRENVAVKVHVTGTNDAAGGGWSDAVDVIGGTLDEWTARFVRSDIEHPVLLRRSFRLRTGIRRATLYVSTFGAAIPRLNGAAVSDRVLSPGWTSYQWHVDYDVYDVTTLVHSGDNAIGLEWP